MISFKETPLMLILQTRFSGQHIVNSYFSKDFQVGDELFGQPQNQGFRYIGTITHIEPHRGHSDHFGRIVFNNAIDDQVDMVTYRTASGNTYQSLVGNYQLGSDIRSLPLKTTPDNLCWERLIAERTDRHPWALRLHRKTHQRLALLYKRLLGSSGNTP